ncbi:MAG: hypothetical protein AAF371_02275 [Pseudomonadota bacterium]
MAGLQDFERPLEPNRLPGAEMAADHVAILLGWAAEGAAALTLAKTLGARSATQS